MILLSTIYTSVSNELKNTVNTPITLPKFIDAANRTIDELRRRGNYDSVKRFQTVAFLPDESDYDIENDLGIDDFGDVWDIRPSDEDDHLNAWDRAPEGRFARDRALRTRFHRQFTVEERDGQNILRVHRDSSTASAFLHTLDSLTADGTWTVITASDAVSIAVDSDRKTEGAASLKFDIDVSNNAANAAGIELSTAMTAQDLSDYENIGRMRLDIDFRQATDAQLALIDSIELRIGSSSSDYLAITTDSALLGKAFQANWNRVSFNWEDGTETGTPDYENVDYLAVIVNYDSTMTDISNVRVDNLKIFEPADHLFGYFSKYLVAPTISSATFQEYFSATYTGTEALRLPTEYTEVFVNGVLSRLYRQKKKDDDPTWTNYRALFEPGFADMFARIGWERVADDEELDIKGNSSGRGDGDGLMW